MEEETAAHHWTSLDHWWDSYVETGPGILNDLTMSVLDDQLMTGAPLDMDAWWGTYVDIGAIPTGLSGAGIDRSVDPTWTDLEPWWDAYIEARADDIANLERVFAESNALWQRRGGSFDADPLSSDWGASMRSGDPLNPGIEEEWSDWLAQLLRADTGEFHRELFGEEFAMPPKRVEREAHLPQPGGTDRYVDILSVTGSGGISIEVKIGDRNFGKTTETTDLIETQRYGDWHHYLLLPEADLWAVRESFDKEINRPDGERAVIPTDKSADVELLYWSDVSRALRAVLLDEHTQSPHWAASAYLFCSQIERKRLGFTPTPVVKTLGTEANSVQAFQSVSIVIDEIETQVEYLMEITEDTNE